MLQTKEVFQQYFPEHLDLLSGVINSSPDCKLRRAAGYSEVLKVFPECKKIVQNYDGSDDELCSRLLDLVNEVVNGSHNGAGTVMEEIHTPEGATWCVKWVSLSMLGCLLRRKGLLLKPENIRRIIELSNRMLYLGDAVPYETGVILIENLGYSVEKNREEFGEYLLPRVDMSRDHSLCYDTRKRILRLQKLVVDPNPIRLVGGDAWSVMCVEDMHNGGAELINQLFDLLDTTMGKARPSASWVKQCKGFIEEKDSQKLETLLLKWLGAVDQPKVRMPDGGQYHEEDQIRHTLHESDAEYLRGICWVASFLPSEEMARKLSQVVFSAYRKLPYIGARSVKIGNAAVNALGMMKHEAALAELAKLKIKVKFATAQKLISKALDVKAEEMGVSRHEVEEMAVPDYGLSEVGYGEFPFGEFKAIVEIQKGNKVTIVWRNAQSEKVQKSIPSAIKESFAEEIKELKAKTKDIQKMLPVQQERIDNLYLLKRTWSPAVWRERYMEHPVIGWVARRLIWCVKDEGEVKSVIWNESGFLSYDTDASITISNDAEITLWHPLDGTTDEVLAWRDYLIAHEITQPFKQAFREIYLLTDAERSTGSYSNRYAAHIIKQHQFNALCGARGWKNRLRLMVDDEYPPAMKYLDEWGLRADFWIEGIGENYGTDSTESGAYLRLATDQVRFYQIDAIESSAHACGGGYSANRNQASDEPIALENIPELVFSEVMRDVDLFVGVASVGNNAEWQDGGEEGRRDYWYGYSFGDLAETAKTRKAVLERLIPRMKIADRCSFEEKFLIVRGDVRTYKIHLGSANILMEPNDQYLCIVAKQAPTTKADKLYLPFEGDSKLSVILSKALMLAEDAKIKDPTILSQINTKR
ncbi:hypothetical protein Rhal01_01922 [Rubritalea halochordaticola]|uniref:DUF4132 domain-containing protein n=2 Tax=Rubritalea halochordaticola TaxID=714537 RepID=A0ABP9UZ65_9BACT